MKIYSLKLASALAAAFILGGCASGGGYVVGNGFQPKDKQAAVKQDSSLDDKSLEKCKTGKLPCGNKKAACSESSEAAGGCKL